MYLGVWPHTVLVMDAAQGKIVDKINLPTDIARTLVLSPDKKTLYASTLKDNSIVTIDLATRKVLTRFRSNLGHKLPAGRPGHRSYGEDALFDRYADHQEDRPLRGRPAGVCDIDLAARKITRMVPYPKDEAVPNGYRRTMKVSPDGKLLYLFGEKIRYSPPAISSRSRRSSCRKPPIPSDGSFRRPDQRSQ